MKGIKVLIIIISVLFWMGCGKVENEIQITEHEQEIIINDLDEIEDNNLQETEEESVSHKEEFDEIDTMEEVNEYMIPEQTFDVYLDDWGEVTFVSCKIPRSIFTDASFFLVKDEQILYQFPHRFKDNRFGYTGAILGDGVGAVGVRDVNFDEKDDIIIISYYESGAGPTGTVPRPYVTIYLAGENEFYLEKYMIAEVECNISGEDTTIENVYNFLIDRELGYNMTWEKAYKNIIHNIEDNLADPYSLRNDLGLYVYIGVHDFDNDSIPELIIGDGISVAVFTYVDGQVQKIADLYEPKTWGSINGLHYKNNYIILESNGSDGSCYVCFTYKNNDFIVGTYDEYNPDKAILNEIVATKREFENVFNLAELLENSRVSYIKKNNEAEVLLGIEGKNIPVRELDFNLVMW